MQQIDIPSSEPLVTRVRSEGNGYTWTLASLLGNMLHIAEDLFGQRNYLYTIL